MKYKVTLNGKTYEVEVEAGQAMLVDEYEAYAPAPPPAPAAAPGARSACRSCRRPGRAGCDRRRRDHRIADAPAISCASK